MVIRNITNLLFTPFPIVKISSKSGLIFPDRQTDRRYDVIVITSSMDDASVLPPSGRTADLTPEYLSASGMVTLSAAWWASSASFPLLGTLVTSIISLIIFTLLFNWRTWNLPFLGQDMTFVNSFFIINWKTNASYRYCFTIIYCIFRCV